MFYHFQTFECGNVCQRDKSNCHVYGVKGNDCYIGDPGSIATLMPAPASEDLKMWMTKGIYIPLISVLVAPFDCK